MKKLAFFALLSICGLMLYACSSDDDNQSPLVTDVVMPPASQVFAPGDEVTVEAKGLDNNDDIVLRILWPDSEGVTAGSADVGVIINKHFSSSITFLAPGGYPASEAEVVLSRLGVGKTMLLGKISIANGSYPRVYSLYGITQTLTTQTAIDRIDMTTGEVTPVYTTPELRTLQCAVNGVNQNDIVGLNINSDGFGSGIYYNIMMNYLGHSYFSDAVVAGSINFNQAAFLRYIDGRLQLSSLPATRLSMLPNLISIWTLPKGITPAMLGGNSFSSSGHPAISILLSAQLTDDSFAPLSLRMPAELGVDLGAEVQAEEMIPFSMVLQKEGEDSAYLVGAYAVANGGQTTLQLYDPITMKFGEELATVPATVRSVAAFNVGHTTAKIFLLCDATNGKRQIRVYDVASGVVTQLPGDFDFSEIFTIR